MPLRSRRPEQLGYSIRPQLGVGAALGFLLVGLAPMLAILVGAAALTGLLALPMPSLALLAAPLAPGATAAEPEPQPTLAPADWPLPDGHFFTQGGTSGSGFAVQDRDGIPFFTTFRKLGGSELLGYPISRRFAWRGFILQVFERAVLQGLPGSEVQVLNLMDELSAAGLDGWLRARYGIPAPTVDPPGRSFAEVFRDRLALLDADPEIKTYWGRLSDPVALYGLPASKVEESGEYATLRTQRGALRRWKTARPSGPVEPLPVGRIAAEAALFPPEPFLPEPAPARALGPAATRSASGP